LHGDLGREIGRPRAQRHGDYGLLQRSREVVERDRRRPHHRFPYLRHQRRKHIVLERFAPPVKEVGTALVMDGCVRQPRFDQLHPPTVHHQMVGRSRDGHGPAEVVGDTEVDAAVSGHETSCRIHTLGSQ
jgi:hypothetical protein